MLLTDALKQHSHHIHDSVDHLVMSKQPFDTLNNYKKFLQAQYEFYKAAQPIYQNNKLASYFDNLINLSRLERVTNDMSDLGVSPLDNPPKPPHYNDNEAIGWLYCVEGSTIGAAILSKHAAKLGLDDNYGASHLAAHPDGRKSHWHTVKASIDTLPLDDSAKEHVLKGVDDAFAYFEALIQQIYGTKS